MNPHVVGKEGDSIRMDLRPRETVVLASDYEALVAWYRDALGFEVTQSYEGQYHYKIGRAHV